MMQQPFLMYPGNAKFLSRQSSHINTGTRTGMIVTLILLPIIAALALGFGSYGLWAKDAQFEAKGINTEAQIVSYRYSRGKSTTYYITYAFTANKQTFRKEVSVDSDVYRNAFSGKRIMVRYLRDNPAESEIAGHTETVAIVIFAIIGVGLLGLSAYIFTRLRRLDRFARTGALVQGMITHADIHLERSSKSRQWVCAINYVFRNSYGTEIFGTDKKNRKDLSNIDPRALYGLPVAVLYIDDKNYIVL